MWHSWERTICKNVRVDFHEKMYGEFFLCALFEVKCLARNLRLNIWGCERAPREEKALKQSDKFGDF
jgi:hypothetical protein